MAPTDSFLNAVIPSRYASVKSLMCGVKKIAAQQYHGEQSLGWRQVKDQLRQVQTP